MHRITAVCVVLGAALCGIGSRPAAGQELLPFVGAEAMAKIRSALPESAAKPRSARKVLVFTESAKDLETAQKSAGQKYVPHVSSPHAAHAVALIGEKTGAFAVSLSSDPAIFAPERLKEFDAIVLANVYLEKKLYQVLTDMKPEGKAQYEPRQKALLEFVGGGKGLVGIHNAACPALGWPEYNKMLGGTHSGQAWWSHQGITVKVEQPLSATSDTKARPVKDDIYLFTTPYSRESVRVLWSVDTASAPQSMTAERGDGDYPVSWIKAHGSGRVFYTSLGHEPATFQDAGFLKHLLEGIQYALGDVAADAAGGKPLPAKADFTTMAGWTPLFDGKNLDAWQVSDAQKAHWVVEDGLLRYSGKAGTLKTKDSFRDYKLRVDWRLPRTSDTGVFVRGSKQLNIWCWNFGSGEMWEHRGSAKTAEEKATYTPRSREDRAVGEWNVFVVTVQDDKVTVELNGKEVISNAVLKDNLKESPIGLQQHGDAVEFKSIYIMPVKAK